MVDTVESVKENLGIGAEPQTPESAPATPPTEGATPAAEEVFDYNKDERSKTMWFNKATKAFDPNLLYKSYKNADTLIEKQYKPLRAQADTFTKFLKDYGYEPDIEKLKPVFDEYKSFKDPENPIIKRGNYFSYFYDNPEYKAEVETLFETLRKKEIRKNFGEGVSDEIVNEIMANRKFREDTEKKEKERADAELHKQLVGTIDSGWKEVEKEAKAIGFPVNEDIRLKLLDICEKEQVDPRFMFYRFQKEYRKEIDQYQRAKIQSDFKKEREKSHKSGVIPASSTQSKGSAAPVGKPSMVDRVKSTLGIT
jgi:hypothetical protein